MARGTAIPESARRRAMGILRKRVAAVLDSIGQECTRMAVLSGSYRDVTGNLRGSVGYVVSDEGMVVSEGGFQQVLGGGDGPRIGRQRAYERARQCPGLVLVVVAGMDYAEIVADRGADVLESAEILARRLLQELDRRSAGRAGV